MQRRGEAVESRRWNIGDAGWLVRDRAPEFGKLQRSVRFRFRFQRWWCASARRSLDGWATA
nr:hypothetical protein JVH1_1301 [Rhodococcus sp. JVH1]